MTVLPPHIRPKLLCFAFGTSDVADFERWVYQSADLEAVLSLTDYLDLISADYRTSDGITAARELVTRLLSQAAPGILANHRAAFLAEAMLSGHVDLVAGLRELVLRHNGCTVIPAALVGIESDTDTVPDHAHQHQWQPDALAKQLNHFEGYKASLLAELRSLVRALQADPGAV
jgi:hypothetical protein